MDHDRQRQHSKFYGRWYVTWTKFESHNGEFVCSAIFGSHSDDGGKHWSDAQEISGANKDLCTLQETGRNGQCDENQFSVPTVAPDGTVYVAFENTRNDSLNEAGEVGDSQYLLVQSKDGGEHWSKPTFIAGLEDGSNDYPINADGRQTLTGYQVRVNSSGNIVASPTDGTLYLAFSDNRNGIHDVANPVTNTDVFVTSSSDGGKTWSSPSRVDAAAGDQWFPWVDVNPKTGKIGIVYNDRGASNATTYGASLAEGMPGALARTTLNTAPSDPVHSIFFQAEVPDCMECAAFHGDYISVAYGSDGHANAAWTDMREFISDPDFGDGFLQYIEFARK
jgi:Neuraminidase (sialidase)